MNKTEWQAALQAIVQKPVLIDASMRNYTTWKIGGKADYLVEPSNEDELANLLAFLNEKEMPWQVLGHGSNILVGDKGIRGIIIRMGEAFSNAKWKDNTVYAQAGKMLPQLALEAAERSLSGLEFAAGIPGSLGGAIRMNAGAYGSTIGQYVTKVEIIEYTGQRRILDSSDITFAYRNSSLFDIEAIVCGVMLTLPQGNREDSLAEIKRLLQQRSLHQPLEFPSCGSVFRNPANDHAGRLIELANLRGMQIGGAMVSKKHGNFIINLGGARAKDVHELIEEIQKRVYEYAGINLEPEVKMIGEFAD